MADFSNPKVGSSYTNFPQEIRDAITAALQQLHVSSHTNIPDGAIKWDSSNNRWKKYNGSAFVDLTSTYAFNAQISATQLSLGDSQKILLGLSNDLEIVHDGGNSVIREVGTGGLYLQSNDSIFIGNTAGTQQYIEATPNNVVLRVGGGEKFRVDSGGAILGDNVPLRIGASADLILRHDTNNSYIEDTGTGALVFKSNLYSFRNAADSEQIAVFNEGGHVALYHANSARLFTQSYGVAIDGDALLVANSTASAKRIEIRYGTNFTARLEASAVGVFQIQAYTGAAWYAAIEVNANGNVELNFGSTKRFETKSDGARFTGHLYANDNEKIRLGTHHDLEIFHSGSHSFIKDAGTGDLVLLSNVTAIRNAAESQDLARFIESVGVQLFNDANLKVFETYSKGIKITGQSSNPTANTWETTSGVVLDGSFAAGIAFKDGTNGGATMFVHNTGAQWALRMAAAGATPEDAITADRNGGVRLYHDGLEKLKTETYGCSVTGNIRLDTGSNSIEINSSDGSLEIRRAIGDPFIDFKVNNVDNDARFALSSGNSNMLESTTGYIVGDTKKFAAGDSQDLTLRHDGTHSLIQNITNNLYYLSAAAHIFQNGSSQLMAQFENGGRCLLTFGGNHVFQTTARGVLVLGQTTNPFGTAWDTDCALNINGAHGGGISITDGTTGGIIQAVTNAGLDYYLRFGAVNATPLNVIYARRGGRIGFFHTLSGTATEQFATSQYGIKVRHPNGTTTDRNPAYGTCLIDGTTSTLTTISSFTISVQDHGTGDYQFNFGAHGGNNTISVFGNSFTNFIGNVGHGSIYVTSENNTHVRVLVCAETSSSQTMDKNRLSVAIYAV